MSKEKQIEEMHLEFEKWDDAETELSLSEWLYNAGYRKQSEGEWVTNAWDGKKWIIIPYNKHEHIGAHCSVCNKRALLNYDKDEVTSKFCPNCGARMKGGE